VTSSLLGRLENLGFDIDSRFHADSLLEGAFGEQLSELVQVLEGFTIGIDELVRGGGGKATQTQRLGSELVSTGWEEHEFYLTKRVQLRRKKVVVLDTETKSETHKIDHVLSVGSHILGLEIEWNNKDPFFNRDLETFSRLHMDGALSCGVLITRGRSLQHDLLEMISDFATKTKLGTYSELTEIGYRPTERQRNDIEYQIAQGETFAKAWAKIFTRDKYGAATTHWDKLIARLEQGVGSPCPVLSIGLPSVIVRR
jgi:hypothetical protein